MRMSSTNQLKAQIKNLAMQRGVDPRVLLRIYMMERFLDRVSQSEYRENFVLKGGMLISYLIGVNLRTTMDIDTTMQHTPLTMQGARDFIEKVTAIDAGDGVTFTVSSVEEIMDEADYAGLRVSLSAHLDGTSTPVKIDLSTGDAITPEAILTELEVMFAGRIPMLVYPTETVIAEKLQTVISRGTFNTRMRDFYDLHVLGRVLGDQIDTLKLTEAVTRTFERRHTSEQLNRWEPVIESVESSQPMASLWRAYAQRYEWANNLAWADVVMATRSFFVSAMAQTD